MGHTEGTVRNSSNQCIYYRRWLPPDVCKAEIMIAHGLAEHGGRYSTLAERLIDKGYAIGVPDLSGHGRSGGYRGHIDSFSAYCDDLYCYHKSIAENSRKPVFLLGHSMGGVIALQYALLYQSSLCGLLLSAPCIKASMNTTPLHLLAAELLSVLVPRMGVTRLPAHFLSRDKEVLSAYIDDPLVHRGKISARLGTQLIKAGRSMPKRSAQIDLPMLILQGTADRLCAPQGSRLVYDSVSSADRTLKFYEGFFHEVFSEPGNEQVFTDVEMWLEEHIHRK